MAYQFGKGRYEPAEAVKKSNQGDMDEKNPVFGGFFIHRRLWELCELARFRLLHVKISRS
jgi:hypothetical protein